MLNKYEELLEEAAAQNISVDENFPFHGNLKGLYVDQNIALSDQLETSAEKAVFWQKNLVITTLLLEIFWYLRSCKCKAGTPGTNVDL